jgi:serine/threonine protein kinase
MLYHESSFIINDDGGADDQILLSSGGTSNIYRLRIDKKFYIRKELKPKHSQDPVYLIAFDREFEIGQELNHPNIVKYLYKDQGYIIQEYLDGETLAVLAENIAFYSIKQRYLQIEKYLYQLCTAVEYLHSKGITHGDIKPQNIIVTHVSNELKLIDFGHAYTLQYEGIKGGTPGYLMQDNDLESFEERKIADLYAIQKIVNELLTIGLQSHETNAKVTAYIKNTGKKLPKTAQNIYSSYLELKRRKSILYMLPILLFVIIGILVYWFVSPQKQAADIKAPVIMTKLKVPNKTKAPNLEIEHNSDAYMWGGKFYKPLNDSINKVKYSLTNTEFFSIRAFFILKNDNQWQTVLNKVPMVRQKALQTDYNKGYVNAYKKSEDIYILHNKKYPIEK